MTLESQVTSLKLSQRLQKLGFPQESYFKWVEHFYNMAKSLPSEPPRKWDVYSQDWEMEALSEDSVVSAYSVAELGEMLPYSLRQDKGLEKEIFFTVHRCVGGVGFNVNYESVYGDDLGLPQWANTEAEARGLMLAYLKENNLI